MVKLIRIVVCFILSLTAVFGLGYLVSNANIAEWETLSKVACIIMTVVITGILVEESDET